ncbi:MAG: FAD-dependent oxidoreductase [Chlorobiales bacterium]|jgi:sulfide dehydrogenase [flavocytochrome c] flavoprotein chain|nr:FAD-dependent oxidoreductase [Chlorobiales bacterium]
MENNKISRRDFNKLFAVGLTGSAISLMGAPNLLFGADTKKVLVVGGGFGGATAARYIKKLDPTIDVTLVEPKKTFYTCPFSNWVLGGLKEMKDIAHTYDNLKKNKITVINDEVVSIDPVKKTAKLKGGKTLSYDRAVVSPGIDFRFSKADGGIEGYDEAASKTLPHAYQAGPQTELLFKQLRDMKDGGIVAISAPENPFRCPPGPYERAALIAYYLKEKKPKSKVIIYDAKEKFSKQALFQQGWQKLYGNMVEWRSGTSGGKVTGVNVKDMALITEFGTEKADVINFIPPQWAGKIARDTGLTNDKGWCPINQMTFESTLHPGIHVIGDACIAGEMPKSGFVASSQAKVTALSVVALLNGKEPEPPSLANTCYSLLGKDYAISVAAVYKPGEKGIVSIPGSGGLSPMDADDNFRSMEAAYAEGWYASLSKDIWG